MAHQLPCPNPVCTHVFSQAEVQRASALKCPLCGQVFQLRGGPSVPQAPPRPRPEVPSPPVATRPPIPPVVPASPVARPAIPVARPVTTPKPQVPAPPPEDHFALGPSFGQEIPDQSAPHFAMGTDAGPLVRSRNLPRKKSWQFFLVVGLVGMAVLGLMAAAYIFLAWLGTLGSGADVPMQNFIVSVRNLKNQEEQAFKVSVPENTWNLDKDIRSSLGTSLALRHREQEVWFAAGAKDYGTQKPRDAELLTQAVERLKQFFGGTLELADNADPFTLAGQSGQRLEFKGQFKSVVHRGECYMTAHHGFGYWVFVGAPTLAEAQQTLSDMQGTGRGFLFATERKGWREMPPKLETFAGSKYPFSMAAPEGVWEKFPALDEDEAADLFLLGRYLKEKDNRKNASVLVLLLPKKDTLKEGLKSARTYVESKRSEESKGYKLESAGEAEEGELGRKAEMGNKPGRVAEFKLMLEGEPKRYMLLGVINEPNNVFAIRCECSWESRQIWRQEFLDLFGTLKVRKKSEE